MRPNLTLHWQPSRHGSKANIYLSPAPQKSVKISVEAQKLTIHDQNNVPLIVCVTSNVTIEREDGKEVKEIDGQPSCSTVNDRSAMVGQLRVVEEMTCEKPSLHLRRLTRCPLSDFASTSTAVQLRCRHCDNDLPLSNAVESQSIVSLGSDDWLSHCTGVDVTETCICCSGGRNYGKKCATGLQSHFDLLVPTGDSRVGQISIGDSYCLMNKAILKSSSEKRSNFFCPSCARSIGRAYKIADDDVWKVDYCDVDVLIDGRSMLATRFGDYTRFVCWQLLVELVEHGTRMFTIDRLGGGDRSTLELCILTHDDVVASSSTSPLVARRVLKVLCEETVYDGGSRGRGKSTARHATCHRIETCDAEYGRLMTELRGKMYSMPQPTMGRKFVSYLVMYDLFVE